jgi:hypothetical protein
MGSSGGSLVVTPDCEAAVLGSNPAISPAYRGLPVLRWAAIWDGTLLKAVLWGAAEENIYNRDLCSTKKKIKEKKKNFHLFTYLIFNNFLNEDVTLLSQKSRASWTTQTSAFKDITKITIVKAIVNWIIIKDIMWVMIVLDRRSWYHEVVVVRRTINLGTGNLEWGGNGEGLRKGEVSLRVTWDRGGRDPITARRVSK